MSIFIIRNEADEVLKKIARQKMAEVGGSFQQCYDETLADYKSGAISDGFVEFALANPDATIILGYGDEEGEK